MRPTSGAMRCPSSSAYGPRPASSIWKRRSRLPRMPGPARISTIACIRKTWAASPLPKSTAACWRTITSWAGAMRAWWRRWTRCTPRVCTPPAPAATKPRPQHRRQSTSRGGRVLVFAFGCESAGAPREWEAGKGPAGVNFLDDLSARTAERVALQVSAGKRAFDIAIVSIHWGGNWGYHIPTSHHVFAHRLIDAAGVDVVHGHSSHHPMGFEVYRGKLILYGCGDFLNDYEGIGGYEGFRSDLTSMYFPTLDAASGSLSRLVLMPMRIRHFRLNRARESDVRWLETTLNREAGEFGLTLERQADNSLLLKRGEKS